MSERSLAFALLFLTGCPTTLECAGSSEQAPAASGAEASSAEEAGALHAPLSAPESLVVASQSFDSGAAMPDRLAFNSFGCTGGNVSPQVSWSGAPEGTKSFAVEIHDPDAPTGVGFFHWLLVNIPATTAELAEGASAAPPAGSIQGYTDYGMNGYGGPCPPPGPAHRYFITVHALDTDTLGTGAGTTGAVTRFMLNQHTLAYGRVMGTYARTAQ